eukprot:757490-Hanusia_phi.AAC.2
MAQWRNLILLIITCHTNVHIPTNHEPGTESVSDRARPGPRGPPGRAGAQSGPLSGSPIRDDDDPPAGACLQLQVEVPSLLSRRRDRPGVTGRAAPRAGAGARRGVARSSVESPWQAESHPVTGPPSVLSTQVIGLQRVGSAAAERPRAPPAARLPQPVRRA